MHVIDCKTKGVIVTFHLYFFDNDLQRLMITMMMLKEKQTSWPVKIKLEFARGGTKGDGYKNQHRNKCLPKSILY